MCGTITYGRKMVVRAAQDTLKPREKAIISEQLERIALDVAMKNEHQVCGRHN